MKKNLKLFVLVLFTIPLFLKVSGQCPAPFGIIGGGNYCGNPSITLSISLSTVGASYQLKKNGTNSGTPKSGTGSSLVMATNVGAGSYTVVATKSGCTAVNSQNTAVVAIDANPFTGYMNWSPPGMGFCVGQTVTFTATANKTISSYQWKSNGTNIPGATSANYTTTVISLAQLQGLTAVLTTSACAGNPSAIATFPNSPAITVTAPSTPSVSIASNATGPICAGTSVTFTATPTNGGSSPTYQWKVNGVNSATGPTFTTSSLTNGQQVSCVMTNSAPCGTAPTATSNVLNMSVNSNENVSVTINGNTTICSGDNIYLSASASTYLSNLTYQWQKNGVNVSSITTTASHVLILDNVADNDIIKCIVTSNTACYNPTAESQVTIDIPFLPPFHISLSASDYTMIYCKDQPVTFTVSSLNNFSAVQWKYNGNDIAGATNNTLNVTASSVSQLQSYSVMATTNDGCYDNATATLSTELYPFVIKPLIHPTVQISQDVPDPVKIGSTVTFTAIPTGEGTTPSFQWSYNNEQIPGATTPQYIHTFTEGEDRQLLKVEMVSSEQCAVESPENSVQLDIASIDWENRNYVRKFSVLVPGIKTWAEVNNLGTGDKTQFTTYLDGLGRSIQEVSKEVAYDVSGLSWRDMVQPIEYDGQGRIIKKYIPYCSSDNPGKFKSNAITSQEQFISTLFNESSGSATFTVNEFENNPLGRIISETAPGTAWTGKPRTTTYGFNSETESVMIWDLSYNDNALPTTSPSNIYPAFTLTKTISEDEKGKKTIQYFNRAGQIILTKIQEMEPGNGLSESHQGWVCTYNVYDDLGKLRFIITPKAVDYLTGNGWNLTSDLVDGLCFKYFYDSKGRTIVKKTPGVAQVETVFDARDRAVFMQDGIQRASNKWVNVQYDALDRTEKTGWIDYTPATTGNARSELQVLIDQHDPAENFLPQNSNFYLLTETSYDHYNYPGIKPFSNQFSFAPSSLSHLLPSIPSTRTRGMITAIKNRVLDGGNTFLSTTIYYDDKENIIQSLSDNILGGTDLETHQFLYAGYCTGNSSIHMSGTSKEWNAITRFDLDKYGRTVKISKNYNGTFYKDIASYGYDQYGRLQIKKLAPGYTGSGKTEMETLIYSYNIQGSLTGINQQYALSTNSNDQWNTFFGMHLGFENADSKFSNSQYNGNITGMIWRSQGDNAARKYDFTYDNLNRFVSAQYQEQGNPGEAWTSSYRNFSSAVTYEDGNGNIKTLKRYGIIPGALSSALIDDLQYSYNTLGNSSYKGNQLLSVTDLQSGPGGMGDNNGKLQDFNDGVNTSEPDYVYDINGNMVKDLNKSIGSASQNGITYNLLNRIEKIVIENKQQIEYTYDAIGTKLAKKVTDLSTPGNSPIITNYIGEYIYVDNDLQFVQHEEGRIKIITPVNDGEIEINAGPGGLTLANSKQGVFEYFITDHLGNTRMVLTEEIQKEKYLATMEISTSPAPNTQTKEERLFGKVDQNGDPAADNEVAVTRETRNDAMWNETPDVRLLQKVSKLTGLDPGKTIGPNMILKVMAGDKIHARTDYFYLSNASNSSSPLASLPNLVASFLGALSGNGISNLIHANSGVISNTISNDGLLNAFLSNRLTEGSNLNAPKAYLNIVFFDEQFKFQEPQPGNAQIGSRSLRVSMADAQNVNLLLQQQAPKNGWAYVYISNESDEPVYFDNLAITQEHGRISEENHYYPFGSKIAAISSRGFNKLINKYGYQATSSEEEEITQLNEFDLRMYDPVIGRWTGADPYDQFSSPYLGMGDDPVNTIDPDGGFAGSIGTIIGAVSGAAAGYFIAKNNGISDGGSIAIGFGGLLVGASLGYTTQMSLFPDVGGTANFWQNLKAFYVGLFNPNQGYGWLQNPRLDEHAIVPDIWGDVSLVSIKDVLRNSEELIQQIYIRSSAGGILRTITDGSGSKTDNVTQSFYSRYYGVKSLKMILLTNPDINTTIDVASPIQEFEPVFDVSVKTEFLDGTSKTYMGHTSQEYEQGSARTVEVNMTPNINSVRENLNLIDYRDRLMPNYEVKIRQFKKTVKRIRKRKFLGIITIQKENLP